MEVFWIELESRIIDCSRDLGNVHSCRVWIRGKGGRGYGAISVRWENGRRVENVHRVVLMILYKWGREDFPKKDVNGQRLEVSHICHNKLCVREQHLVIERHEVNIERNHCRMQSVCSRSHVPFCLL